MSWWSWLLWPFAVLYDIITRIRNYLFDINYWKSIQFETNVISIGNLSVGGTGKTPMVEYLIRLLCAESLQPTTLSRGYGRKTSGFRLANEKDTPDTIGDEPYMYLQKFEDNINVAVGVNRELAIPEILYGRPATDVVLLDDAFQQRVIHPNLNILLTTFEKPFYDDYLLPAGRLRETRNRANKAHVIIVSKCPQLSDYEQVRVEDEIRKYSTAKVFFTRICYDKPLPLFETQIPLKRHVVGISGIANARSYNDYLLMNFNIKLIHNYRDHHRYSKTDIKHIIRELDENTSLICTEKDAVKLKQHKELQEYSTYYLPIETQFLKNEALFRSLVLTSLKSYDIL